MQKYMLIFKILPKYNNRILIYAKVMLIFKILPKYNDS